MKKLLITLFLLALNSHAQVQENFYWEGVSYKAQSTNYISKVITPLGDGLIQFDLITTGCVPGGGGGGHLDDCDLKTDKTRPGEVFRSQLYDKRALPTDQPLEFSFKFKDISKDDGLGFDGPGLTIFELYPTWTPTRMSFGGFPTHHIWYNPKDKTIEANIRWQDDNNPIGSDLSVVTPGWNNFIVQTNQTTKDDGYLRIIHNGKIIADYKGKTSYESPKGVNYIFGPYACCGFTKKGEPNHSFLYKDVKPSIGVGGYDSKLIIDSSASKMNSEALASVEVSNAFDGSYWFVLNQVNPEGTIINKGYGPLLINDGEVTIKKGTEGGYNESGQMSQTVFDTFKGKIDKNGDIVASFYFSICGHCGLKEQSVLFSGNIKSQKLSGMYDDVEVIFDLKEKANIETSAFQNIAKAQPEESELFKGIKTSNTFDGYYGFTNMMPPSTPLGYGTLEINNGIVSISQGSGNLTPKYDSFEGRIDQNGDIVANFYFAPCTSCGLEDKLIVFEGNINKKKLSGKYNDSQIYFYLTGKKGDVTKVETKKVETSNSDPTISMIIEVTHGDKLIVDIAEPHELAGSNIKVSLKDIDTPDATKSCPKQMELGIKVRDFVAQKLNNASSINLTNFRKTNTKIIAQVIVDGGDLGEELVSKGYASEEYGFWKPYFCSALSATNQADQYYRGNDEAKSIFWYERSIVLDPDGSKNQESHFLLSKMYFNLGNTDKSLENLKKSASLNWVPAMEQLGFDYLNGNVVKKDSNQGKKWLKKAFDKGSNVAEGIYCSSLPKAKQKTCKF